MIVLFFFLSLVAKWGLKTWKIGGGGVIIAAGGVIPFFMSPVEKPAASELLYSFLHLYKETSILT